MPFVSRLEIIIDSRTGERSLRRVEGGLNRVDAAGNRVTGSMDHVNNEMGRLRNVALAASGALLGLAAAFGTQDIIQYADAWTNASNQLRQATDSTAELAEMQTKLVALSKDTRSNFNSTATLYSRLARSTTDLGLSSQDLLDIVTTINQSFALSGATASEASGAIFQLTQGLAAGALRGEEFNSVAEQAPILMQAIAKETGMTLGELREFAATGGITAEIVVRALEGAADTIGGAFAESIASFSQNMEIARTNMVKFVGTSDELSGSVDALGSGLIGLTENLDSIVTVATLAAGVYGARLAGSLVTATGAMVSNTVSSIENTNAQAAASAALLRRTAAEKQTALALLSTTQLEVAATRGTNAHAFALAQLSVARQRAALAAGAHATATATATTAMTAGSVAARGLTAAMGLLGGPVGIALIAAGSLYYFRDSLFDTTSEAEALKDQLGALTDQMEGFSRARLASEKSRLLEDMSQLRGEANLLKLELNQALEGGGASDGMGRGAARISAMKDEIQSLQDQAAVMQKSYEALDNLQDKRDQQAENERKRNRPQILSNMQDLGFGRSLFDGFEGPIKPSSSDLSKRASGPSYDSILGMVDAQDRGSQIIAAQQAEFEATRRGLDQKYAIEQAHQERMQALRDGERQGLIENEAELNALVISSTQQRNDELARLEQSRFQVLTQTQEEALGALGGALGNFADIAKEGGKETFQQYKNLATGEALIATALAVTKALGSAPPPFNFALAASIGALGAVQVAQIQGQQYVGQAHDGHSNIPTSGTWNLEKGERVMGASLNRDMTQFLDRENRGSGGAQSSNPVTVTNVFQISTGVSQTVQAEIAAAMPMIEGRTVNAVQSAISRGGSMARAVGRK